MKLVNTGLTCCVALLALSFPAPAVGQNSVERLREAKQCLAYSMFSVSFMSNLTEGARETAPGLAEARQVLEQARASAQVRRRAVIHYANLLPDGQRPSAEELNQSLMTALRELTATATQSGGLGRLESLNDACDRFDRVFAAEERSR
jgi:hypothetical protein